MADHVSGASAQSNALAKAQSGKSIIPLHKPQPPAIIQQRSKSSSPSGVIAFAQAAQSAPPSQTQGKSAPPRGSLVNVVV